MAFSPGGIIPLPFPIWLGFPDGLVVNCYHLGMEMEGIFFLSRVVQMTSICCLCGMIWSVSSLKKGTSAWRESCSDIGLSYDMSGGMRKPVVISLYLWNNY